jgi:hypothetical protein
VRDAEATSGRRPGIVDGLSILPYWTDPHQNLSLDVNQSTNRLKYDLAPVRPENVTVEPGRLAISLPVYADAAGTGLIRLTDAGTGVHLDFDAGLRPSDDGCVLEAGLAERAPAAGHYKIAIGLGDGAAERKPTPLRLALTVDAQGAISVRAVEDTAREVAAKPARGSKPAFVTRVIRKIKKRG